MDKVVLSKSSFYKLIGMLIVALVIILFSDDVLSREVSTFF
jgi:hypothetical protein